jgi:hypothetical protein
MKAAPALDANERADFFCKVHNLHMPSAYYFVPKPEVALRIFNSFFLF